MRGKWEDFLRETGGEGYEPEFAVVGEEVLHTRPRRLRRLPQHQTSLHNLQEEGRAMEDIEDEHQMEEQYAKRREDGRMKGLKLINRWKDRKKNEQKTKKKRRLKL